MKKFEMFIREFSEHRRNPNIPEGEWENDDYVEVERIYLWHKNKTIILEKIFDGEFEIINRFPQTKERFMKLKEEFE